MRLCGWVLVALLVLVVVAPAGAAPEGQMTWGVHTTLVPTYFDPAETIIVTSFMVLYGIHDALVKPMPGKSMAPSLAESWTVSPDGLVYDFVLRKGVTFHNGDPITVAGIGRRVEESGLGLIAGYAFSAPYEDVKIKGR